MSPILSKVYWVLDTQRLDGTFVIGASFIFLAYFLHPAVAFAYQRVKAYLAWQAIEKRNAVEVTNYPMLAEIFGGRGEWDAPRIITILLALFSLASWGLELSMEPAIIEGLADLLNRPTPVEIGKRGGLDVWLVKSCEELDYDGDWKALPNMFNDHAKSRYSMESGGRHTGEVNGDVIVAYWYSEPDDTLFYYTGGNGTTVEGLQCADNLTPNSIPVYRGGVLWGSASECDEGPRLTSDIVVQYKDKYVTPPTITMTRSDGDVFVIVEESSSYPTFLYSIWTVGREDRHSPELRYEFHIAATMRLAEAVVTGLVQGEKSGGGCFGLLRKYSENRDPYDNDNEIKRAMPFGERPSRDSKANIQDKEIINVGLKIDAIGLLCLVCIVVLTSVGVTWAICLHSGVYTDVYDRDELVRAASFSGAVTGGTPPSAIRIFVRKEDEGNIGVVVSDATDSRRRFAWALSSGLVALVTLSSWFQEHSGELVYCSGKADVLNRAPLVTFEILNGSYVSQVRSHESFDYDEHWQDFPNIFEGHAKSTHSMEIGSRHTNKVNGDDIVACWYTEEADDTLFYSPLGDVVATTVEVLGGADDAQPDSIDDIHDNNLGFNYFDCEQV